MTSVPKNGQKRPASIKETGEEFPQEQWQRFEAAVDAAVKSGPKHRVPKYEDAKGDHSTANETDQSYHTK